MSSSGKKQRIIFRRDLFFSADFEELINSVLNWAYDIYESLFFGQKSDSLSGKHLCSYSILTHLSQLLDEAKIPIELIELPDEKEYEKEKPKFKISLSELHSINKETTINRIIGFSDGRKKQPRKKILIGQEFIEKADFCRILEGLLQFLAEKTAEVHQISGSWRPDVFGQGELEACDETQEIIKKFLSQHNIKFTF